MTDRPRLIEVAFPLRQTSLDSVHEKNVRHGHISTLHIWPARRQLAACCAALIATLLPDPSDKVHVRRAVSAESDVPVLRYGLQQMHLKVEGWGARRRGRGHLGGAKQEGREG